MVITEHFIGETGNWKCVIVGGTQGGSRPRISVDRWDKGSHDLSSSAVRSSKIAVLCKLPYTTPFVNPDESQLGPPAANPDAAKDEVATLATSPRRPLTLADLLKHGRPPLSKDALLASANFTLSLLPARLASRIQALRNLPFIVVSNPHVSKIYHNYLHSFSTLLPYQQRRITTLEEEQRFGDVLADLVQTHANTIPVLARGFLECRKYVNPEDVTRFLDTHLRARIGTRLIAEQHLALHFASQPVGEEPKNSSEPPKPKESIPLQLHRRDRYRASTGAATIESGNEREPIEVTIAAAPDVPGNERPIQGDTDVGFELDEAMGSPNASSQSITIRIRDRGGGIPPEVLPHIWSYSFTTFSDMDFRGSENGNLDALNTIAASGGHLSSIAGLGYGLPALSRAYAEYFGGSIAVQSLWGWGTDVYLTLQGVGKID
ncbi:hypothetical protein N7523_006521 [Penicillium sp. IBT 18751x]|nr:hypothetical protein N7523_006521 [Penicillium sp. IBT 18751x]